MKVYYNHRISAICRKKFPEKHLKLSFVNPEDEKEPEITAKVCEILDSEKLEGLGWKAEVSIGEGMKRAIQIMAGGE